MLETALDFLIELVDKFGYFGVLVATIVESFFAPIPSEIVLATAGLYARQAGGIWNLMFMGVFATIGSFLGTLPFYFAGRIGSGKYLDLLVKKFGKFLLVSKTDVENIKVRFNQNGKKFVFFGRFIPGIRSIVSIPAGLSGQSFSEYSIFTLLGSFLWNFLFLAVGFFAFEFKEEFFNIIDPIENILLFLLALVGLVYVYKVFRNYVD